MSTSKPTIILAIESSCDETACAVVQKYPDNNFASIIASTTATSLAKHKVTKGIVPEVAAREQLQYILPVIENTLAQASLKVLDIDFIAVTVGPGLVGSLLVGIETARALSFAWNKPIIPVNHIQAHPYANFIIRENTHTSTFPLLSWVISGGHTEVSILHSHSETQKLGSTIDDAAGECFDKCARVLGFDYPGGPFIEKIANETAVSTSFTLPRPLLHDKNFNMSFSGLKTAFFRTFEKHKLDYEAEELNSLLAQELQEAVTDIIIKKTEFALQQFPEVQSIIVSGGVAANKKLREKLKTFSETHHKGLYFPPLSLCTDNAAMIGTYALFHTDLQTSWKNIAVQLN